MNSNFTNPSATSPPAPSPVERGKKKPEYTYSRWFGQWRVYKMQYIGDSVYGEKVADFGSKEEARAETYKLNGWKTKTNQGA